MTGLLSQKQKISRVKKALEKLSVHASDCRLCPRECGVDRNAGELGFCRSPIQKTKVSHALLHFGEEPVLSGCRDCNGKTPAPENNPRGSGTIFFSGCNLRCVTCQNYQISHEGKGRLLGPEELAQQMLKLQTQGALNINLVSPSHVLPAVLAGLKHAYSRGLSIPLVYNTHGYEKASIIRALDGIVDIYLPDVKYYSRKLASRLARAPDYFTQASPAVQEMYCQQPRLEFDSYNRAKKGLIIRHLVLPGQVNDSLKILKWIRRRISPFAGLSLMSQYRPCFHAPSDLQRRLKPEEYQQVVEYAEKLEFEYLFVQTGSFQGEGLLPDFNRKAPFLWNREGK